MYIAWHVVWHVGGDIGVGVYFVRIDWSAGYRPLPYAPFESRLCRGNGTEFIDAPFVGWSRRRRFDAQDVRGENDSRATIDAQADPGERESEYSAGNAEAD